jgi:hypothetical protein
MQKIFFYLPLLIILSLSGKAKAQISIGKDVSSHASAILDVNTLATGGKRGVLIPRIPIYNSTDRTAISAPDDYLLVFSPYTVASSFAGLSYWHNNRWNHLINQTDLYPMISSRHISQVILFAKFGTPETTPHVTDAGNAIPYPLQFKLVVFDSQNAYKSATHEYIIPEDGLYEITCESMLQISSGETSMETFVTVNGASVVSDVLSKVKGVTTGAVIYTANLKRGDRIGGAAGIGYWAGEKFMVIGGSLTIIKY